MKLLGSTISKIKKDQNGENLPYLEITEVVFVHCNTVNNNINKIQEFQISNSVNYQIFHKKKLYF